MKIDRLLFLAASASMAAGAAACGVDRVQTSMFHDVAGDESPSDDAGEVHAHAHAHAHAVPYFPGAEDASEPGAAPEASTDADASSAAGSDASDAVADAAGQAPPVVMIPDGTPDEICAPFTCELGEASCRAAVNGGVTAGVAVALYACATTACTGAQSSSAAVTECVAAALSSHPTTSGHNALCSSLSGCTGSGLTESRCEVLYSGLTPMGATILHDRLLECGTDEETFVRATLSWLASP